MKVTRERSGMALTVLLAALLAPGLAAFAQPGRATRPQVPLPEAPLREVILHNCVSCHGIDDYAFHALSRERWQTLLREQHWGLPVNILPAATEAMLLDWLAENFGTEQEPFPRQYVPPEIDTFFGDDEGRLALDSTCTECHELDRVYETRGTVERWRVLLLEMRARGAALHNDHQMERMAE